MKLLHVSLTARDAATLSNFYEDAFGYVKLRPPKRLFGDKVSRGNGLPDADIFSVWLQLPDDDGPFLEILEFKETKARQRPLVNEPGFSHLAFEVQDLAASIERVLKLGGALQGDVTDFGSPEAPHLIIYVRDPEGNILELEQPFRRDEAGIEQPIEKGRPVGTTPRL